MSNVSDGDFLHAILKDEEGFDQLVPMQVQADAELVARFVADDVSDTQSLVEGS